MWANLARRRAARLRSSREEGFTLIELLVSILLLGIAMAMIVPVVSVLLSSYSHSTNTLSSDNSQALLSLVFDRTIQDAAIPPCTAASGCPPASTAIPPCPLQAGCPPASTAIPLTQAVFLACPDAMVLYSGAPLPGLTDGGGWVYIYLAPSTNPPGMNPPLPAATGYAVYTLNVDEIVGSSIPYLPPLQLSTGAPLVQWKWNTTATPPTLAVSQSPWTSCGPLQPTPVATSTLLSTQPGYHLVPLLTLRDVVAPTIANLNANYPSTTPSATCLTAPAGSTCDPFTYFDLSNSGASSVTNVVTSAAQTTEMSYDITVRHLSCSACSANVLNEGSPIWSPPITMQGSLTLPNVLIADGEGAGLF